MHTKVAGKLKTHILYSISFFFESRAVFKITWKSFVEPDRPQMAIKHGAYAMHAPKTKATNTPSEYVIFIAYPPRRWLHERASVLNYTYSSLRVLFFS